MNGEEHQAQELSDDALVGIESTDLAPNDILPGTNFRFVNTFRLDKFLKDPDHAVVPDKQRNDYLDILAFPPSVHLSTEDVNRWKRASHIIEMHKDLLFHSPPASEVELDKLTFGLKLSIKSSLGRRRHDLPHISEILEDFTVFLAFTVAALIYGGLHALAWYANFRTPIEQTLWRSSTCVVMAGNPGILILNTIKDKCVHWYQIGGSWNALLKALSDVCIILMGLVILAYTLARAYLVVECFIGLTHLPAGAFEVPNWVAYFPHI